MSSAALDKPADLTLWPTNPPTRVATGRSFSTLREALTEAATAINMGHAQPWIITEDGDILALNWIKANANGRHLQQLGKGEGQSRGSRSRHRYLGVAGAYCSRLSRDSRIEC